MFGGADNLLVKSYSIPAVVVVVLVVLLILIFNKQLSYWIGSTKNALVSTISGETSSLDYENLIPDESDASEFMDNGDNNSLARGELPPGEASDTLTVLGMTGSQPWDEVLAATELDPSTFANHYEFVKDVRRFSSGSNFTSVQDDNTSSAFTNFVGLRRPQHVSVGATARQQPSEDQDVLMRNEDLRWGSGPTFNKFY